MFNHYFSHAGLNLIFAFPYFRVSKQNIKLKINSGEKQVHDSPLDTAAWNTRSAYFESLKKEFHSSLVSV